MSLTSEPARPHDLEPALALLREAELPTNGVLEQFGHFFVVRDAGLLVGVCGLEVHGEDGLLRSLVVAPTYRGKGVAADLVAAALGLAHKMSLRAVYLLTTTARDYFGRLGFVPFPRDDAPAGIRESWEFQSGCPKSSAFMRRAVGSRVG
jgi:N-acetylglutamate synthase-like GNAT family acetyltransferase